MTDQTYPYPLGDYVNQYGVAVRAMFKHNDEQDRFMHARHEHAGTLHLCQCSPCYVANLDPATGKDRRANQRSGHDAPGTLT